MFRHIMLLTSETKSFLIPGKFNCDRSDSDDAFEAAPSSLQAGRRKRKVVAEPRGGRVRERRFKTKSLDSSDEDNHDPREQVNPKNHR